MRHLLRIALEAAKSCQIWLWRIHRNSTGARSADSMQRLRPFVAGLRESLPALAFLGGFAWDSLTLGRRVSPSDLWLVAGYWLVAGLALVAGAAAWPARWPRVSLFVLQFALGGVFSALTVLYFVSSAVWFSLLFVAILIAILIGNEFLEEHYRRTDLAWSLHALAGVILFNFLLPFLFGSVHWIWFYVGVTVGLGSTAAIRSLVHSASVDLRPAYAAAAALTLLYLFNAIPPVPLVQRELLICRDLRRVGDDFAGQIERPAWWRFRARGERTVHQRGDERIYCYSAIFAPRGVEARVYHHWKRWERGRWVSSMRVPIELRGGRQDGFRTWTHKQSLSPGRWRVVLESASGAVIGRVGFEVRPAGPDQELDLVPIAID